MALLYLSNSLEPLHLNNHRHRGRTSVQLSGVFEWERSEQLLDICAYALMPNHFHLLIHEHTENGTSKFMQKVLTGYTMYFNTRYERSGALFQGKFRAEDANDDRYLKYLISYIHLNPIKLIEPHWKEFGIRDHKRAERFLEKYRFSSYPDYSGDVRPEHRILTKTALPEYFGTRKEFTRCVTEWLDYTEVEPR